MRLCRSAIFCLLYLACRAAAEAPRDVEAAQSHLSQAAAALAKGDDRAACAHLGQFLAFHPEHRMARFYRAELLVKLGRAAEAAGEFELAVRYEQDERAPDVGHLVHCHTRLVELAEGRDDAYAAHLHRGIALVLLARQRARLADPDGALPAEGLLCKATAELARAGRLRPDEARACWYLAAAWRQLGQSQPAGRWLAEARRRACFADLTPAERRDLWLACRAWLDAPPR